MNERLLSAAYNSLLLGVSPALLLGLALKGVSSRQNLHRWRERLGKIPFSGGSGTVWVHAVSVGEVQAAIPLIGELQNRHPERQILVTTTTPTGSQQVRSRLGDSVLHCYLPFDLPFSVKGFLDSVRPDLAVIMENESWPNLFWQCRARQVPIVLANARISPSSYKRYKRLRGLMRSLLREATVLAQSGEDAERFLHLGSDPERTLVCGNLKYDLQWDEEQVQQGKNMRKQLGGRSFVWIGASTRQGEEELLLQAHSAVTEQHPHALLILVPRHPERFQEVAEMCLERGFSLHRRSQGLFPAESPAVYLGDSMGELPLYYAASDLAFVGGSLAQLGGQNPLEPAALGLPVVMGPHVFNFAEITRMLAQQGGLVQVTEANDLARLLLRLIPDPDLRARMGEKAAEVVQQNRGAVDRVVHSLEQLLPAGS